MDKRLFKNKIFHGLLFLMMTFSFINTSVAREAYNQDIIGVWQTYDEKTGNKKVQVTMFYDKKSKTYYGRLTKITPVYGYKKPRTHCTNCVKPFTGRPLLNLVVIWNVKALKDKAGLITGFDDGYILDPVGGKIYRFKGQVSKNNKILKATAYLGTSLFSRTQNWARVENTSDKRD